jgi:hypothetical protein
MPQDTIKVFLNYKEIDSLKSKQLNNISVISSKGEQEKNIFGISQNNWNNIVLPIFIPLITFLLGLLLSRVNSKLKLRSELKRKETFLFEWIELIIPRLKEQIKGYEEYSEALRNGEILKSGLKNYNLQLDKLRLVDPLTLVSIFVTNKTGNSGNKNKIVFDLQNSIDFIETRQARMLETQGMLKEASDNIVNDNNVHAKEMNEILRKIIQDRGTEFPNDEFVFQINSAYNDWAAVEVGGLDVMKKHFVDVASPICRNQLDNNPGDKLALDLLSNLQMIDFVYMTKVKYYNSFANQYSDSAKSINASLDKLKIAKDNLSNLKFRFFLFLK